jgi:CubicO group peptidase (beta-lactamase class C family)
MTLHLSGIEARIEREMAAHRLPGFALAIVRGDEVLYARGFGVTSTEDGLTVTPETLFCVGSIFPGSPDKRGICSILPPGDVPGKPSA